MDKYEFEHSHLARELTILLSVLNASAQNNLLVRKHNEIHPKTVFPIRFTEWEIVQEYLISSAIKLRIIDDKFKNAAKSKQSHTENVGLFLGQHDFPTNQGLPLREACNKIVHAQKIEIDTPVGDYHLNPTIFLEGEYNGHWKVELNVQRYVCSGLAFIKLYEEDPYL